MTTAGLGALYSEEAIARGVSHEAADLQVTTLPYRLQEARWRAGTARMRATDAQLHAKLEAVARAVETFYAERLAPRWAAAGGTASFTMDVEVVDGDGAEPTVSLVELNCFGAEFAAASALYHWTRDARLLYRWSEDGPQPIVFRVLEAAGAGG